MSKIEVNAVEPQCGTTLTLGASGDTVALASGASQTGFGRTGTVNWITTPKTATFTAVSGEGYFCNTSGGAFTVNLPAGVAGAIVSVADYARTWDSSNITVAPNGSEKIGGIAQGAVLNTEGQSVTLVFVDSTQGWVNTMDSTSAVQGLPPYITATGGTITNSGNFRIHTFTGPGTFCVTSAGAAAPGSGTGSNLVDYMVVAGGSGGGSGEAGAGGGAGGFRESPGTASGCYTASPRGAAPAVALSVSVSTDAVPSQSNTVLLPPPLERKENPHPYSPPIDILGIIKYSNPIKPLKLTPKFIPDLLLIIPTPPLSAELPYLLFSVSD